MWATHIPAHAINCLSPDAAGESPPVQRQAAAFNQPALSPSEISHQGQPVPGTTTSHIHLFAKVNHIPHLHPKIPPGSEQTQPKQKYLSSCQQCSPHLETFSFTFIQCQNVMMCVCCADPGMLLRMLLPPVYHQASHLAYGHATTGT